jgi:hypothetical protein
MMWGHSAHTMGACFSPHYGRVLWASVGECSWRVRLGMRPDQQKLCRDNVCMYPLPSMYRNKTRWV